LTPPLTELQEDRIERLNSRAKVVGWLVDGPVVKLSDGLRYRVDRQGVLRLLGANGENGG
jgi:hypothetical protein